jgi:hypothetical protein
VGGRIAALAKAPPLDRRRNDAWDCFSTAPL